MWQYLIVCPLVFLAGLVDSIAGGGGLISLPAYLIAGVPAHVALGTNKLSSTLGTTVSTLRFAKNGFIEGRIAVTAAAAALIGSVIGANLSLLISESVIKSMMIVVLPIVAFYVLKNKNMGQDPLTDTLPENTMLAIAVTAAFFLGAYDGFYGPGTGTFLILVLTGVAKMNVKKASGLTKVINLSSNVAALITFIINGKVLYPLGIASGAFCIAGHYIGSGMVVHNGQKIVRPVVLIVLTILFIKIISGQ
ncbi:MAG: TSUP family transporter [Hungatella sp.]